MRVLLTEENVQARVRSLAERLDNLFRASPDLVLVGVLRGAVYFLADLSRAMRVPHRIDWVEYASYAGTSKHAGRIVKRCSDSVSGSDVVLVDEIFDTGETLQTVRKALLESGARSLTTCVLVVKSHGNKLGEPDLSGFHVGPEFLVGYGLDHNQHYRHLPYIAVLEED
jgi:hypoxanthine phosphoribosyltransferase